MARPTKTSIPASEQPATVPPAPPVPPVPPAPVPPVEPPVDNVQPAMENVNNNDEESVVDLMEDIEEIETFAITPAVAKKQALSYANGEDSKIFKSGAMKLTVDINGTAENLNLMLAAIEDRAVQNGWLDTILNIYNSQGEAKDLLTHYGELSIDEIRQHVLTYIHKNTRAAQDSMMMYQCISNSMTQEAQKKVMIYKNEYYVDERTPSGPLMLKVLIRESYIDTNATVKIVQENLSSLDTYMVKIDSNIEKFNRYVYGNLMQLNARGCVTNDLMANLFKGYAQASDKAFVAYIAKKEDDFDEGRDIGHAALMHLALQKYKVLKESGKWNAPTEAETKIIALEAEVTKLKAKNAANTKHGQKGHMNKAHKASGNGKFNGTSAGKKAPPEWMTQKPKDGEPHTKMMGEKEYHWCPNHEAWTRHKPSECKGKGYKFETAGNGKDGGDKKRKAGRNSKGGDKKKPKMVALTAMYGSDGEEE